MLAMAPARMLAPLLALDAAGPISSKAQLRLLALLAQRELRGAVPPCQEAPGGPYRPEAGRYGPRCGALDLDASSSPALVEHCVSPPSIGMSRFSHSYAITARGRAVLASMEAAAGADALGPVRARIRDLCADMPVMLLGEACRIFGPAVATKQLEVMVADDLARTMKPIRSEYERSARENITSIMEIMETAGMALSEPKSKDAGGVQRRVILCAAGEAILECGSIFGCVGTSDDLDPDPRLADADDLVCNLTQYCEKTGIMRDPMSVPLKDLMSEDDARSLCRHVEKALDSL